jgi:hypothetical protein
MSTDDPMLSRLRQWRKHRAAGRQNSSVLTHEPFCFITGGFFLPCTQLFQLLGAGALSSCVLLETWELVPFPFFTWPVKSAHQELSLGALLETGRLTFAKLWLIS